MPDTTLPLAQVQLAAAQGAVYTAPSQPGNLVVYVDTIWVCNTDTVPREVTLRYGSGTLTAANSLLDEAPFPTKTTAMMDGDKLIILTAGQKIEGLSDAANVVTVTLFGRLVE